MRNETYGERIYLTGGSTEDDTESILVVPGGGLVHHLDGATGESESLSQRRSEFRSRGAEQCLNRAADDAGSMQGRCSLS